MLRFHLRVVGNLLAACVACFCDYVTERAVADDATNRLRVISELYAANREACARGRCRFAFTVRSAESEAAALTSNWSDDVEPVTSEFELFAAGPALTVKSTFDNDTVREKLNAHAPLITPVGISRKNGYALDFDGLATNAIVHSPDAFRLNVRYQPFNLSRDSEGADPASAVDRILSGKYPELDWSVKDSMTPDGQALTELTVVSGAAGQLNNRWSLDAGRGYLPVVTELTTYETGTLWGRMFLLDIREHAGCFFPMHSILAIPRKSDSGGTYTEVREMKVTDLDLDYVPTDDDLTLQLPRHTQFWDGIDPKTSKSLFRDGEADFAAVSVDDLPAIYSKLTDLAAERRRDESAVAERREAPVKGGQSPTLAVMMAVSAALIAAYLFATRLYRRRSR